MRLLFAFQCGSCAVRRVVQALAPALLKGLVSCRDMSSFGLSSRLVRGLLQGSQLIVTLKALWKALHSGTEHCTYHQNQRIAAVGKQ